MGYTDLVKEGLKYAPTLMIFLLALITIIVIFFKYLDRKDKRDQQDFDKRDTTIKDIASQAFEVHKESNRVITENSKVLGAITQTMQACNKHG